MQNRKYWLLFGGLLILRGLMSLVVPLIDDEPYYWSWIRYPFQLSYFDHPALLNAIQSNVVKIFGSSAFSIRITSFLMFCGIAYVFWLMANEIFGTKVANAVGVLVHFIPIWGIAGYSTVPDSPFALVWLTTAYIFVKLVRSENSNEQAKYWVFLGISFGIGLNSKFIILTLAPGMLLYVLLDSKLRKHLLTKWPWIAGLIVIIFCIPIILWNMQNGWPSFRYQFYSRHTGGGGFSLTRWLSYFGYQWIFITPGFFFVLLVGTLRGLVDFSDWRNRILICLAMASVLVFWYQPFYAEFKPHWAGPAYMFLFILAIHHWYTGVQFGKIKIFQSQSRVVGAISIFFLILINLAVYIPLFYPLGYKVHQVLTPQIPWQPKWDFSNEFYGWEEASQKVLDMQKEVTLATNQEPIIAANRYELVGRLTFYTQSTVWKLSHDMDMYTFFQPKSDLQKLVGRSVLFVSNDKYPAEPTNYFLSGPCNKTDFPTYRNGIHSRTFYIWHCQNYQGLRD